VKDPLGPLFQEAQRVRQLPDVVLVVAALLLQQRERAVELLARVRRLQTLQVAEHLSPRRHLLFRALHARDLRPVTVLQRQQP
jgi:hypothetical protein